MLEAGKLSAGWRESFEKGALSIYEDEGLFGTLLKVGPWPETRVDVNS